MITNRQFLFILMFTNICVTPFVIPSIFFKHLGHGAYIPIIFIYFFTLINIYVTVKLCRYFEGKNIIEWSKSLFGKWIGSIYGLIVMLIFYLWGLLMLFVFIEIIIYTQLPQTSRMLLIFFILAVTTYILRRGLSTFSRFVELFAPLTIVMLLLINVPQFMNISFNNYLPLRTLTEYGSEFFHYEIIAQLFVFRAVFTLYFFNPYMKQDSNLYLSSVLGTSVSVLQVFLALFLPLGIFGQNFVNRLTFPYQESLETVSLTILPIDRISILTSIIWQLIIVYVLYVSFFAVIRGFRTFVQIKNEKWLTYGLITLTFFVALYPVSREFVIQAIVYWSYAGIFFLSIVPMFVWLYVRSKEG